MNCDYLEKSGWTFDATRHRLQWQEPDGEGFWDEYGATGEQVRRDVDAAKLRERTATTGQKDFRLRVLHLEPKLRSKILSGLWHLPFCIWEHTGYYLFESDSGEIRTATEPETDMWIALENLEGLRL